jgi:rod shape-determining protein MreD
LVRWFVIAILSYACLVIQTAAFHPGGLAIPVDGHSARPDLLLIIGLFLALFYRPAEVFVAGWCLGLASDLVSVNGRLGLQALEFSILLALVSSFQTSLPRTRILMQCVACLALVLVVHGVWYAATRLAAGSSMLVLRSMEEGFLDAAYSGALAPYLFWLLLRLRSPLGISAEKAITNYKL